MAHEIEHYQLLRNGLLLGADTVYRAVEAKGLDGHEVRSGDTPLPRAKGDALGEHHPAARIIELSFTVEHDQVGGPEGLGAAAEEFMAAFRSARLLEAPLEWSLPGRAARMVHARVLQSARPINWRTLQVQAELSVQLKATDPSIYSIGANHEWTQGVVLQPHNVTPPGLDYPLDYPKDWPDPVTVGGVDRVVHNGGNDDAYPVLKVTKGSAGQTTGLTVTNGLPGESFVYTGTIDPGQTLTVDFAAAVPIGVPRDPVLLSGASRYGSWQLPRDPMRAPSGDSTWRLVASGNIDGLVGSLTWTDTSSS